MKTPSRKTLAIVGGCAVLVGGWYKVVWSAQTAEIATAKAAATAASAEAKKSKLEAGRLEALKADTSRAAVAAKLDHAIPENPDLATYLRWIQTTAADHHLVVPAVAHSTPAIAAGAEPTSNLAQVTLTITADGSYDDILQFVHTLEVSDRLIIIDSLGIAKGGAGAAAASDNSGGPATSAAAAGTPMTATIAARMFARGGIIEATPGAGAAAAGATPTTAAATPTTTAGATA